MISILPFVIDDFLQRSHQFFTRHIVNTESLCDAAGHQAVHVVALVPEQREHQHGHGVADSLVDAVGPPVSDEGFGLGMGWGEQQGSHDYRVTVLISVNGKIYNMIATPWHT